MSSDLFDQNRGNLKRIFEAHQLRGCILFTDILKICTATRIFPNLLTSKDLRKLIIQVTNISSGDELSAKLSYEEMELFLKAVAEHSYPSRRGLNEQYRMLFMHMRNPCYLRYNLILETEESSKSSKKSMESSRVSVKTTHGVLFKPFNEKSCLSSSPNRSKVFSAKTSSINALISPKVSNNFGVSLKLPEDSSRDSSAQPSPKLIMTERLMESSDTFKASLNRSKDTLDLKALSELISGFKEKTQEIFKSNKCLAAGVRRMDGIRRREVEKRGKVKLAFNLWKWT